MEGTVNQLYLNYYFHHYHHFNIAVSMNNVEQKCNLWFEPRSSSLCGVIIQVSIVMKRAIIGNMH